MSLRPNLNDTPVLVELIPPPQRTSESYVRRFLEKYVRPASDRLELDACNIPEIVEENHRGEPLYKNMDPRAFARRMQKFCGPQEVVVNKIVVHCRGGVDELRDWAVETRDDYGIQNVVAVGGNSSKYDYPGPPVLKANEVLRQADLVVGNIMIPERRDEAERIAAKTRHGAEFFTTQVIFSAADFLDVLRRYDALCEEEGLRPATVFVSFAPVSDPDDVTFLRWLGVNIPRPLEDRLLNHGSLKAAGASVQLAIDNWKRIRKHRAEYGHVPMGLNVEYINRHNFEPAMEMARRLIEVNGT